MTDLFAIEPLGLISCVVGGRRSAVLIPPRRVIRRGRAGRLAGNGIGFSLAGGIERKGMIPFRPGATARRVESL